MLRTSLVDIGRRACVEVEGALATSAGVARMQVEGRGVEWGIPIGPVSASAFSDEVTAKARRVTRHISGLSLSVSSLV